MARYLDMVCSMLTTGPFTLPMWKSVLMVSGGKPCSRAGTALRNQKLAAPCPRSKRTPRSRARKRCWWSFPSGATMGNCCAKTWVWMSPGRSFSRMSWGYGRSGGRGQKSTITGLPQSPAASRARSTEVHGRCSASHGLDVQ